MIIQNVKGGYDFAPKEQKIRNYINEVLKRNFEEFGYLPIETPILCYFDMLAGKYDENNDILNEIYRLKDQGKRDLGLRYDLTVSFAKFIALNKNELKLPFKRYEINKVFRDGPVKLGRDREFTQCDVDVVGISGQMIEAELLNVYVKAFKELNIEIIIKYNSRNLMRGLIIECGVETDLGSVITIIDKKDKVSSTEFKEMLMEIGLTANQTENLLKYFSLSLEELTNEFKDTENKMLKTGLEELNNLEDYLKATNLMDYCTFSSTLARGQDYYTGNVFEVYEKNGKLTGSIGAGGRYDNMVTEFIDDGEFYPAVGVSFGLTSIYELLKDSEEFKENSIIDLYIIPMNTPKESLKLANDLREYGLNIDLEMQNKKLKKSLDFANKENIPYVIIFGEDEIKNQGFKLKDMRVNQEFTIKMSELEKVKEIIKKD